MLISGMHGLGDNLHQRSIVREFLKRGEVWLETPWPSVYHDLEGLHLVRPRTTLRTQAKNAQREAAKYERQYRGGAATLKVWYRPHEVRRHGSVLAAMSASCGVTLGDFTMPVPESWRAQALSHIPGWDGVKPLLFYRPLVERTEWGGCGARNPDREAYAQILESLRDAFYVVSIADLVPGKEWIVSQPIGADTELHAGELSFEALAGMASLASLVYCSPGFAVILAQSVGTPSICVFGGYENSTSFAGGAQFAPYLGIDPVKPCDCFSHSHACQKHIDIQAAKERARTFIDRHCAQSRIDQAVAA